MGARKSYKDENVYGGDWSLQKLECVEEYLDSYLTVMLRQDWAHLYYIDAFSGDGLQRFKETHENGQGKLDVNDGAIAVLTEGSALRAIKASSKHEQAEKRGFDQFLFLELNQDKLNHLKNRISEQFPDQLCRCRFVAGDVNETLPQILREIDWRTGRGVSFIDPFATQLNWSSVEKFKDTHCDVWMLFPLGDVIRMLPREKEPPNEWANALNRVFGDSSWRSLYRAPRAHQLSLFGEEDDDQVGREEGTGEVLEYITGRLQTVFASVCKPAELRTSRNAPLFALYAMIPEGSRKAIGASRRIADYLLRKLEVKQLS